MFGLVTRRIDVIATDDPDGERVLRAAPLIGVDGLSGCRVYRVYHVRGEISTGELEQLCAAVLVDPVVDRHTIDATPPPQGRAVEVAPMPGVSGSPG